MLGKNRTVTAGEEEYKATKALVIATGSRVKGIPQIGLELNKTTVISSDEALFLEEAPKTLAVVGAGAVGCEFADIFNAFGTKVTLIEALPRILPLEDAESSRRAHQELPEARHHRARRGQDHQGRRQQGPVTLTVEAGGKTETIEVGEGAHGRRPGGEHRVAWGSRRRVSQLTERGFVKVNPATLETTAPGVYGIGDVAGPADARAQGQPRRRRRGRAHRGAAPAPDPLRQRAQRDLLPSRGGQHRAHRGAGQGAEARLPGRPLPVQRQRPRPRRRRDRGVRQDHPRQEVRRDPRAPTSSAATRRR